MDDRELLEFAAKACGYQILRVYTDALCLYIDPGPNERGFHWNPLTSDGDALRLAVKLRLNIHFGHMGDGPIHVGTYGTRGYGDHEATEWDSGAEQESARRAIVRVAASIGKEMP